MEENETVEGQEENVVSDETTEPVSAGSDATPDAASASDPADDPANAAADAGDQPEPAADESAVSDVAPESPDESAGGSDSRGVELGLADEELADDEDAPGGAAVVDPPAESMTDRVQSRMVSSIEVGRGLAQESKARNLETKKQQQVALSRTNRPDNESKTQAELEDD